MTVQVPDRCPTCGSDDPKIARNIGDQYPVYCNSPWHYSWVRHSAAPDTPSPAEVVARRCPSVRTLDDGHTKTQCIENEGHTLLHHRDGLGNVWGDNPDAGWISTADPSPDTPSVCPKTSNDQLGRTWTCSREPGHIGPCWTSPARPAAGSSSPDGATLAERLRTWADDLDEILEARTQGTVVESRTGQKWRREAADLLEAQARRIDAVRALHVRIEHDREGNGYDMTYWCDYDLEPWPCDTIKALEAP